MSDQFDLEQGIMGCWHVTSDLDVLFEELCENTSFTTDQTTNFVLGLKTIYEAKFQKLFRDFESFLKTYYAQRDELKATQAKLYDAEEELEAIEEANEALCNEVAKEDYETFYDNYVIENDNIPFLDEEEDRFV